MHRLLSLNPFNKAQEQNNHAAGDGPGRCGPDQADRAVSNGTDSHVPAHSKTTGANPESNIDVSVLTKALPLTLMNQ